MLQPGKHETIVLISLLSGAIFMLLLSDSVLGCVIYKKLCLFFQLLLIEATIQANENSFCKNDFFQGSHVAEEFGQDIWVCFSSPCVIVICCLVPEK